MFIGLQLTLIMSTNTKNIYIIKKCCFFFQPNKNIPSSSLDLSRQALLMSNAGRRPTSVGNTCTSDKGNAKPSDTLRGSPN